MNHLLACGVLLTWASLALDAAAQARKTDDGALDTQAQAAVKKLPKEVVNAPAPRRFATRDVRNDGISPAQMEEIRVYGQVDPEDYARRNTSMQQFHNRLENDRPSTPKEKTKALLCFIGLCANYGPDGLPREPSLDERSEARTHLTTTQLNAQFRGTLQ
ncbi:MAG: hypothetical protein ABI905_11740 [Betaproteobacteria bacterium]